MKHTVFALFAAASALSMAPAAFAASDYFLKIEGVTGEASPTIEIQSWSWGATQSSSTMSSSSMGAGRVISPRDPASGQATGRRSMSVVATGDVDGDGRPNLAALGRVSEVQGFSVTLDQASAGALGRCATGKHFPKATITMRDGSSLELTNVAVSSCTVAPASVTAPPVSSAPLSSSPRQTQGSSFGERCNAGACAAPATVTLTLTGQMRHTKTGHVTLMK